MKVFPVSLTVAELAPIALNDRRALLWQHGDRTPAIGDTLELVGADRKCHRVVTDVHLEDAGAIVSFRPLHKSEKEGAAS